MPSAKRFWQKSERRRREEEPDFGEMLKVYFGGTKTSPQPVRAFHVCLHCGAAVAPGARYRHGRWHRRNGGP